MRDWINLALCNGPVRQWTTRGHPIFMKPALREAGIKRDKITTLYADGETKGVDTTKANPWTLYFTKSEIDTPASLVGDSYRDIKQSATRQGISATFDDLAKKVKDGDHLVFFVTDHGSKYDGITLWNGESYSVSDLESQLAKLPSGVSVHLATNICYGGQLLRLTKNNVCVVTNTDDQKVTYSNPNDDPFATGLASGLKNRTNKTNGGVRFIDAFQSGKSNDLSSNGTHLTSVDYFIENQRLNISPQDCIACQCQNISPLERLQREIAEISEHLSKVTDKRKPYYEKYLKDRITKLSGSLDSYRNRYSNYVRGNYQKELDRLKGQWEALSERDKQRLRPYYTGLAEKLRAEDEYQRKKLDDAEGDHKRALAELKFLRYASPSQLEQYYNIRKCLEYEI